MYYIYRITNKINGKTYIGQHKYKELNDKYMGSGVNIRRAQKKYGMENFEKEILYSRIQYKETVDDMERFAIAKERALGKAEYNIRDGGGGCAEHNTSEETKRKMSESHKGKKHSEETRKKISESNKGKRHSDESYKRASEKMKGRTPWCKGKKMNDSFRKKCGESHKGKAPWNKGKKWDDEMKQKAEEVRKAYRKSGRKDWNAFQKEYAEDRCV